MRAAKAEAKAQEAKERNSKKLQKFAKRIFHFFCLVEQFPGQARWLAQAGRDMGGLFPLLHPMLTCLFIPCAPSPPLPQRQPSA